MSIWSVFVLAASVSAGDVEEAVRGHAEHVARVTSYRIRTELEVCENEVPGRPLVLISRKEFWSKGKAFRERSRTLRVVSPDGEYVSASAEHGNMSDTSFGDRDVRALFGWDPEHPLQVPLEFGRSAADFGTVSGSLGVRDPTAEVDSEALYYLGHHVVYGASLAKLAKTGTLVEIPSAQPSIVRLELTASQDPAQERFVGATFDLDTNHGWLVRRIEWAASNSSSGARTPAGHTEVIDFKEPEKGIWVPTESVSYVDGKLASRMRVTECSINMPLNDDDLVVSFPEGAKVNDISGKIHLWGKGEPAETFSTFDGLMDHLYAKARDYQRGGSPQPPAAGVPASWILAANLLLVAVLFVLFSLRRRLST